MLLFYYFVLDIYCMFYYENIYSIGLKRLINTIFLTSKMNLNLNTKGIDDIPIGGYNEMNNVNENEKMEDRLHMASSYLRADSDNHIMFRGNRHPYCRIFSEYDEKKVSKKPSKLKRLLHTFLP